VLCSVLSPSGCLRASFCFVNARGIGVFVVSTRGAAADEAGGSSAVKGSTVAAVDKQCARVYAICGSHSGFPTPYPPVGCTGGLYGSGGDGRARRHRGGKRAVCACLWRADACAQGVPVARTAGVRYASYSGQRAARVDSVTSQCALPALPRRRLSMLTRCARVHWPRHR